MDNFLPKIGHGRVLDCGAGIGRVTKNVLLERFDIIDLVEPSGVLLQKARILLGDEKVKK